MYLRGSSKGLNGLTVHSFVMCHNESPAQGSLSLALPLKPCFRVALT